MVNKVTIMYTDWFTRHLLIKYRIPNKLTIEMVLDMITDILI